MNIPAEFDSIRPYSPEELPQVYAELTTDPQFQAVISKVMPHVPFEMFVKQLQLCKTNLDFQKVFIYKLLKDLVQKLSGNMTACFAAQTNKQKQYTFISNHRDIILDPALLSVNMIDNGFPNTVEIAIGDNLLVFPWIKKLVRITKSFIIERGLSLRQQLQSSMLVSKYMHYAITQKHENLWIAQRQGRAKDSNDVTQESILKMLVMAGEGDIIDRLKEMHIVPLTISYEYDPCDYLKAQEMQQKRDNPDFKKSQQDDLENMQIGFYGYKGGIHFQSAPCIDDELDRIKALNLPKTEIFSVIAKLIDKNIHANYRLYPGNYIAYDALNGTEQFADKYSAEQKERFEAYLTQQIAKIVLEEKDEDFLRKQILAMYANPVVNHLAAL